jgi:hypothetical protein
VIPYPPGTRRPSRTVRQDRTVDETADISIRVRPQLKEALEKLAKADRRSLASYLEIVLEQYVAKTVGKAKQKGVPLE